MISGFLLRMKLPVWKLKNHVLLVEWCDRVNVRVRDPVSGCFVSIVATRQGSAGESFMAIYGHGSWGDDAIQEMFAREVLSLDATAPLFAHQIQRERTADTRSIHKIGQSTTCVCVTNECCNFLGITSDSNIAIFFPTHTNDVFFASRVFRREFNFLFAFVTRVAATHMYYSRLCDSRDHRQLPGSVRY